MYIQDDFYNKKVSIMKRVISFLRLSIEKMNTYV